MKSGKYTKFLAKIQVRGIFRIRDIQRNVLPKFIEICMETPSWCPPGWAQHGGRKPTKTSVTCYLLSVNLFLGELINIKVILFLIYELFRWQNSPKYVNFFNLQDSSLGRHVKATSRKSLEVQSFSITKPRTLLKRKFV